MWIERQFPYFCWMILCGACIVLFYDLLRISRRIAKQPDFIVNIEDVVYACICAVIVFYVTYLKNDGEIRIHTVMGLVCGSLLYCLIIRNKVVDLGSRLVMFIIKILGKIIKIFAYPFVLLFKILVKPARIIIWYSGKSYRAVRHKTELKLKNIKHRIKHK